MMSANEMNPPEKLKPWLFHEDSLTEKLKISTGDASIQRLAQGLHRPGWWEKHALGIQEQLVFKREIVMYSHETRCWYARTIAPESTYQANQYFFKRLEKQGLHVMLFHEKLAVRQSMVCYAISQNELEFYWVKPWLSNDSSDSAMLWVRRCCFLIDGKAPFYLVEIFLPELLDLMR